MPKRDGPHRMKDDLIVGFDRALRTLAGVTDDVAARRRARISTRRS